MGRFLIKNKLKFIFLRFWKNGPNIFLNMYTYTEKCTGSHIHIQHINLLSEHTQQSAKLHFRKSILANIHFPKIRHSFQSAFPLHFCGTFQNLLGEMTPPP